MNISRNFGNVVSGVNSQLAKRSVGLLAQLGKHASAGQLTKLLYLAELFIRDKAINEAVENFRKEVLGEGSSYQFTQRISREVSV